MTTALILIAVCLAAMAWLCASLRRDLRTLGRRQNAAIVRSLRGAGMSELARRGHLQVNGWSRAEIDQAERDAR